MAQWPAANSEDREPTEEELEDLREEEPREPSPEELEELREEGSSPRIRYVTTSGYSPNSIFESGIQWANYGTTLELTNQAAQQPENRKIFVAPVGPRSAGLRV